MINIQYVIFYFSVFVWLLPLFKQFRTEYFYFFLVLAILDPVKLLVFMMGDYSPVDISILLLILLVTSLFLGLFKKYFLGLLIFAAILSYFGKSLSPTTENTIKVVVYTFILVVFLLRMSRFLIQSGKINLFQTLVFVVLKIDIPVCAATEWFVF